MNMLGKVYTRAMRMAEDDIAGFLDFVEEHACPFTP